MKLLEKVFYINAKSFYDVYVICSMVKLQNLEYIVIRNKLYFGRTYEEYNRTSEDFYFLCIQKNERFGMKFMTEYYKKNKQLKKRGLYMNYIQEQLDTIINLLNSNDVSNKIALASLFVALVALIVTIIVNIVTNNPNYFNIFF